MHHNPLKRIVAATRADMLPEAAGREPAEAVRQRLIGTWRLVAIDNSPLRPYRGEHPIGLLFYDRDGNMAVQIAPSRPRAGFAGALPTADEALDACLGYTAYFGTYSVDAARQVVVHHRDANLNPGATGDYVRRYRFLSERQVVLMPVENDVGLRWERIG